ncbi:MAG: rRNA methyltransferase [Cyclobacteriaceae bacterium]|nr:rRNA methyltransferase [Cyclobacteriaceae bacterium]
MKNRPSLPKEFEERMRNALGETFGDFVEALQLPSPTSIRINPRKKITTEGEPVAWSKFGKYLTERPVFTLDPVFHAGAYYSQEASSMFLEQAVIQSADLTQPLRVLDLCAAPGGKSTHLLSLLNEKSLLVANEVIQSRASILSENIQKWGHANVVVSNNDPENFSALPGFFDMIVADAPCSGEGLFRKDPEAVKEWSAANVDLCTKRQRRILADVWPALKTNGVLIYCTCTYNESENEENIQWLSEQHSVEPVKLNIPAEWNIETVSHGNIFGYRFYPHKTKGEGFFISVVRKTEHQPEVRAKQKQPLPAPPKKISEQLATWFQANPEFFMLHNRIHAMPAILSADIAYLMRQLKIIHAGTPVASVKHDKLIPEHGAALSVQLNHEAFQKLEVNKETALRYLRKEPIDPGSLPKGFALVVYENLSLGWVNVLDNRLNNLYPKEWRIRMNL